VWIEKLQEMGYWDGGEYAGVEGRKEIVVLWKYVKLI